MKCISDQIRVFAAAVLAVALVSCNQKPKSTGLDEVTEEEKVLQSSVFYPGELTPEASTYVASSAFSTVSTTGESGVIAPPGGTDGDGDGGSIDPGTTDPGGASEGTDPGTGDGETTVDTDPGTDSDGSTGSDTGGDGTVADGSNPGSDGEGTTDGSDGDSTVDNGGSDGGTINDGATDGSGGDGGTVADGGTDGGTPDSGTDPSDGGDDVADGGTDGGTPDSGTDPSDDGDDVAGGGTTPDGTTDDGTDGTTDEGATDNGGTVADGDDGTIDDPQEPGDDEDGGTICEPRARRMVANNSKITLCHVPPGNPDRAHNITVGEPAVDAHLAHGDHLGHCGCPEQMKDMKVKFSRICSRWRSGIPYPQFVFFEEAQNPLMSIEAAVQIELEETEEQDSRRQQQLAALGLASNIYWYTKWNHKPVTYEYVPIHSVALHDLNLFEGQHVEQVNMTLDDFRAAYPAKWDKTNISVKVCDDTNYNGLCSDEVTPYVLSVNRPSFTAKHIPEMVKMDVWHGRHYLKHSDPEYCEKQYSPIVLDLGANGILLSGPGEGTVFDLNDTGESVYTGWTRGLDDALLVRDVNGNGVIDSGAELFGSATRLKNGERASDGYAALAEFDDDGDGRITPKDTVWSSLRVWLDRDSSGTSEPSELLTLDQVHIESMDLNYVSMMEVDKWGNETRMRSTFRRTVRGKSRAMVMVDVWFNTLVSQDDESLASN